MPTPTYTPLANLTLSGSASTVTFSSIGQGYRDLVLVIDSIASSNSNINLRFNDDTASNYSVIRMTANGTSAESATYSGTVLVLTETAGPRTDSRSATVVSIMDYSATDKHKTVLSRANNGATGVDAFAGRWASTASITKIAVNCNFAAGTTLALYGIAS